MKSFRVWLSTFGTAVLPLPLLAAESFKQLVDGKISVLGNQMIALLYALCFVMFLIGMVRLFFSSSEENRKQGRMFAIYSIIGLVVLFAVWGFVRALLGILDEFNA